MRAPARPKLHSTPRGQKPIPIAQFQALAKFRHALRSFLAFSEAKTLELGVTAQQYQALLAIKAHAGEGASISDLASELLLKHNGAVQLVDRLVAANLVRRKSSAKDGRVAILRLTRKGEARVAVLASAHLRNLISRRAEWAHLSKLVGKMRSNGRRA